MSRGAQSLYQKIFNDEINKNRRKGRCDVLNSYRNELLIDRYFFYVRLAQWRYEIIIKILSAEFFLSPVTIPEILADRVSKLKYVKRSYKELEDSEVIAALRKKWPHMVWRERLSLETLDSIKNIDEMITKIKTNCDE